MTTLLNLLLGSDSKLQSQSLQEAVSGFLNNSQQTESFEDYKKEKYGYGLREDGTQKGFGYFGEIPTTDGSDNIMGELGSEMTYKGKNVHFPLLVPTLTRKEIDHLATGKKVPEEIWKKAMDHAIMRIGQGKDPFAHKEEEGKTPIPEIIQEE